MKNTHQAVLVDKRDDQVDAGERQIAVDEIADAPREYVVDHIVRHVDEGDMVKCIVRCYGYIPNDDTVRPTIPITEHFISTYRGQIQNIEEVSQHY